MNCKETRKNIEAFVNDSLSVKELEEFLEHLDNCEKCREEYDMCYTVFMGMKILEDVEKYGNTRLDSEMKIESAKDYLFKYKIIRFQKILLYVLICLVGGFLFF
ncbi:MAG: zf-HC2 domain-containing protein [Lachnospiraceae bacterium]|nr:zf-HC2 domain-containing protein [Lachnospiraceae bacterium]